MFRNHKKFGIGLVALMATALVACGGSAPQTKAAPTEVPLPKGDAVKGKELFLGTCVGCHGEKGTGMPGLGKDLTVSTWVKGATDRDLLKLLTTGRPASDPLNTTKVDMPTKGGNPALKDADLIDIIAFVRSINK